MNQPTVPAPSAPPCADRTVPVTRVEVLDFVGELFDGGPVDRAALLAAAGTDDARPLLAALLDAVLPQRPLTGLDDLWRHLDLPEDLTEAGFRHR